MAEELYPIAVLIEELKNEDVQMRLNSIKRLSTIALALGEERTRRELIPFLTDSLDDEDEILLAVAEELSAFTPLVGKAHAHTLLPPLESLAHVEETIVREKAVEALVRICNELTPEAVDAHFIPLVKNLASGDWFASRASACGLFGVASGKASEAMKIELRGLFTKLCNDDTPMVRRAAASNLGKLGESTSPEDVKRDLLPLFQHLVEDEQDSVRLLAVEACLQFARLLSHADSLQLLVGPLHMASKDRSWRVRHVVAEKFCEFQEALGADIARAELIPLYSRLLQDQEAEVRTQAVLRLPNVGAEFEASDRQLILTTNILPHIVELCSDSSQHVRVAVASVLVETAPLLGKDGSLEHLVPLFIRLLKDEHSDVRLNVINKLDVLQNVIGVEQVASRVIPEIVLLAEDPQWRVRLAIVEQMPLLGKNLGPERFDSILTPLCFHWLQDNVYAIRESTAEHLRKLVEVFGVEWAKKTVLPQVVALGNEKAYLSRLTSLFVLTGLAEFLDTEAATQHALPVTLKLAADNVANVKFNAARTLHKLIPKLEKGTVTGQVKPCLQSLSADVDLDVKYYSQKALAIC